MLVKTITYTDWNDEERTEDFRFNLTRTELTKFENSKGGGLTEWIKHIVQAKDNKAILDTFDDIIKATYGVKSLDGKTFIKNDQVYEEFKGTGAYDQLFMELVTDATKASEFLAGCLPKEFQNDAKTAMDKEIAKYSNDASAIKKVES